MNPKILTQKDPIDSLAERPGKHSDRWALLFACMPTLFLIWAAFWGSSMVLPLAILGFICMGISVYFFQTYQSRSKSHELNAKHFRSMCDMITRSSHNFLVDMIVDLRRPLHGLIGTAQLYDVKQDMTEDERSLYDLVDFCSNHMLEKLERMQFFSELEAQQVIFNEEKVNLRKLLEDSMKKAETSKGNKKIRMSCHIEDDLPQNIMVKPVALSMALHEILKNALLYTAEGRVKIECKLDPMKEDHLLFTVKDSGPGLTKKQIQQSFGDMHLIQPHIPWHERGTGLGVSIIKGVIRALEGEVWVESERRQGCAIHFSFPVTEVSTTLNYSGEPGEVFHNESLPKVTDELEGILLVEDEPFARTVMNGMLKNLGFTCDIAKNGEQALSMARKKKYALIFMDIQMPKMDGWEATKSILEEAEGEWSPNIVALTSHTRSSDKQICHEAGMKGFLSKPVKKDALKRILEAFNVKPTQQDNLFEEFTLPEGAEVIHLEDYRQRRAKDADSMQAQSYLINFNELYNHYSEDVKRCEMILTRTVKAIAPLVAQMKSALRHENVEEMNFLAHQLKGEFSFIMCESGVEVADHIEVIDESMIQSEATHQFIQRLEEIHSGLVNEIHQLVGVDKTSA